MTDSFASLKRRPVFLLAVAGLAVAGIADIVKGEYLGGSIVLGAVGVFTLGLTGLAERSWAGARALDALTLWVVGAVIWLLTH